MLKGGYDSSLILRTVMRGNQRDAGLYPANESPFNLQ